jgi:hypothetical protein
MNKFDDIYNSIKPNFAPQNRSIYEIGIILSKFYKVLNSEKISSFKPFESRDSVYDINRTTIEKLIQELTEIKIKDGTYTVKSEAVEKAISDIRTLEIFSINPNTTEDSREINSGYLKGNLRYLIEVAREGLIFTKRKIITDNLNQFNSNNEKLNYLNKTLISIKQNKSLWDQIQFSEIVEFIELEKGKWQNINTENTNAFSSSQELFNFIIGLIESKLNHNIRYSDGYKIF